MHKLLRLDGDGTQRVEAAIARAEAATSAEIKLVVVRHCWDTLERKAARTFQKLGLHETADRNAVLILVVTTNREFLIRGDRGIHEKVGQGFWDSTRDAMLAHFRENDLAGGLCEGIRLIGDELAKHFPVREGDVNEVPNDVVRED